MVAHQHPRVNPPSVAFTNLSQTVKKGLPVIVGHKHRITTVATGHDMIHRAGILESWLPSHKRMLPLAYNHGKKNVNLCTLTPFIIAGKVTPLTEFFPGAALALHRLLMVDQDSAPRRARRWGVRHRSKGVTET